MNTCKLNFSIESSNPTANLTVRVKVDQLEVFNGPVNDIVDIDYDVNETDGNHELTIELLGKTSTDTVIDSQGNIIEDAVIKCSNFTVDNINFDQLMFALSTYTHDFNGTENLTVNKFYGTLGCNGVVRLEFTTPIYIWLLEHM